MSKWMNARKRKWRVDLLAAQDGKCAYCGTTLTSYKGAAKAIPSAATFDHVVPKSEGGSNDIDNFVLACLRCNASKSSQSVDEFVSAQQVSL